MQAKRIGGLLKFFDRDTRLDGLLSGHVYFNTPEYYRLASGKGRADPHESCAFSFRKHRGDPPVQMKFADKEISEILTLTISNGGRKPGWLHCWTAILVPATFKDLRRICDDINRMREEFDKRYVFLPRNRIRDFATQVQQALPADCVDALDYDLVKYSPNSDDHDPWCKATAYAYQSEYRFVLGECEHTDTSPRTVKHPKGFHEILVADPAIQIFPEDDSGLLLLLDANGCKLIPTNQPKDEATGD
ncbi:MAG: hypothetical protein HQ464_01265 [Planctomycetes bacterium]|nr:hypothetical protein [Planctomycetota bacterium]